MARKRSNPDGDRRPVNVKLSPTHHKLLRMISADMEMSMSEYASAVVVIAIESDAKRKNITVTRS